MKELQFIEIITKTLSDSSFIGDDTAFVDGMAITQDTLIEDVHFRQKTITAYELGQKAVNVNLSDLAAAGATPKYLLVSISLPKYITAKFVEDFYTGINEVCKKYDIKVIGGDITGSEKIAITVTAIGSAKKSVKRSSAEVGDVVCTTGEHGNSRAGLEILEKGLAPDIKFEAAHKLPIPKIKEGIQIAEICQNPAMMDTSDGLGDALYKIAKSSGVSIEVDFEKVPYDAGLKSIFPREWQDKIIFGGEDYELVFCIKPGEFEKLQNLFEIYQIGTVVEKLDAEVVINFVDNKILIGQNELENLSFNHFIGENE